MNEFDFTKGKTKRELRKMIIQSAIERISLIDKDFGDLFYIWELIKKGKIPNPFRLKHIASYYSPVKSYRLIAKMVDLGFLKKNEVYDITYYEVNMKDFEAYINDMVLKAIESIEELKKKLS
jgi:hypothetical protein